MERTFLQSAISKVLPDLSEANKDILEEHLQSLGVETSDDFQFIEEGDLLSALRPIQARKLLAAWKLRCKSSFGVEDTTSDQSNLRKGLIRNIWALIALLIMPRCPHHCYLL